MPKMPLFVKWLKRHWSINHEGLLFFGGVRNQIEVDLYLVQISVRSIRIGIVQQSNDASVSMEQFWFDDFFVKCRGLTDQVARRLR